MSVVEKRNCIEPDHPDLSVVRQYELIGLPRSSFYRKDGKQTESEENLALMWLIDEEYTRHPFYGSRQMHNILRRQGHKIYPYLLRGLTIDRPNLVWCTDLTYICLVHGFVYLTAVKDWHSRYVLSWEVSVTMEESACVSA